MPQYSYTYLASDGKKMSGLTNAKDRSAALVVLRGQGVRVLSIREAKAQASRRFKLPGKKVGIKDLVVFTRELATMIDAGVPLPRSLATLSEQTENKHFKVVIEAVTHDIESGLPLADAMAKHSGTFSEVYINMVRAGEAGGILNDILKRLATQVEKDSAMRHKIRSAMAYPVVILTVTIVAFFGIMLFIMPKISKIITDLGGPDAQLPIYTEIMIGTSNFMSNNAIFIIVAFVAIIVVFRRYIRTEKGRYRWHLFLLRMPIFGKIISKVAVARFSRTFASLMGAGVSVLEALEVTGKAVGNRVIQHELDEIAKAVKNGQPLGKQLSQAAYFPPIVGQMMTVGEETGKIDEILVKVADFYEQEVDAVIDSVASIIEPIMIVLLGAIVGLIAASVMGPIAGLSKNIGG
ncbi:secretion system protein [Candidatus Saccharibacteria bacterium RIFCSPHIGHO2_12_FULL_49_19]|nr:MAG: secretion system protein [Candidatus Saccharibacteria bacterium RIFCSPHIGHO2_01_FULL_49_21]OGL36656.1 MAG: secretion system protein [Candidatus Saccharibacteria bacterium RIFCSPHIGHO2_12_FULL_49_19]OGL38440.1 MAG: secretion system protein [Candidatus Saccharibacteria bacterium RIFCSPLOWO2_01_FULL_49_22]